MAIFSDPPMTDARTGSLDPACLLAGTLHLAVAFDWGDEIDLEHARRLAPAQFRPLARRPRTPPSIAFRPAPLRIRLPSLRLALPPLESVEVDCEATVFDFAGVSVALHVPFRLLPGQLVGLAGALGDPEPLVAAARQASEALYQHLLPAIRGPLWSELSEEYVVFQFAPGDPLPSAEALVSGAASWLAALVRLEAGPLSPDEIGQSLRMRLSYTPADLLVLEWSAAILVDANCEETLQTIEFANLQLLEFRHTDNRLDDQLAAAYALIHSLANSRLPFWRTQARPLRVLGDLKIEANVVFERTSNVLKLMGDQYLARVYRMLAGRFHLEEWTESIQRSLSVVESVYQSLSDQAAKYRTEFLELIVVLLIGFEVVMAWLRR